mmetsp:Transcript_6918/g.14935  ORF Transcript_6918/g.14935 Transcript_6918/m.14935 type:complete len:275 (-) Transcript_6918:267-1091(-)
MALRGPSGEPHHRKPRKLQHGLRLRRQPGPDGRRGPRLATRRWDRHGAASSRRGRDHRHGQNRHRSQRHHRVGGRPRHHGLQGGRRPRRHQRLSAGHQVRRAHRGHHGTRPRTGPPGTTPHSRSDGGRLSQRPPFSAGHRAQDHHHAGGSGQDRTGHRSQRGHHHRNHRQLRTHRRQRRSGHGTADHHRLRSEQDAGGQGPHRQPVRRRGKGGRRRQEGIHRAAAGRGDGVRGGHQGHSPVRSLFGDPSAGRGRLLSRARGALSRFRAAYGAGP